MIPKIIHYCWFGRTAKPTNINNCIKTWKTVLSDYKFIEWNEDNFNISYNKYTLDAYNAKKYAFVSDVARLTALYEYGGIYLDTDVIVYKSFDNILCKECVLGFEEKNYIATSFMACQPKNEFIKMFLDYYINTEYGDFKTNVTVITHLLEKRGLIRDNSMQFLKGDITVYPQEYFSPYDYINCIMKKTNKTMCAHMFYVSWANKKQKTIRIFKGVLVRLIGSKNLERLFRHMRKY